MPRARWDAGAWNRDGWWTQGLVHGHLIVGTLLGSFTTEASAELAGYPATNVRVVDHPRRSWRAEWSADLTLTCTLTEDLRLRGVILPWINTTHVRLELSADGTTWTDADPAGLPLATVIDPRTERRKTHWWQVAEPAPWVHAIRLRDFGPPPAGAAVEVGAVAVVAGAMELTQNVGFPITWTVVRPATRVDFQDGSVEWNAEGPARLRYQFQSPTWRQDRPTMAELLTIVAGAKGRPIVIDENRGNPAHVYVGTISEDFTAAERFAVFDAGLQFEEFG